jgi:hypothetical protein
MYYPILESWGKEQLCSSLVELSLQDSGRDLRNVATKSLEPGVDAKRAKPDPEALSCFYRFVAHEYENVRERECE